MFVDLRLNNLKEVVGFSGVDVDNYSARGRSVFLDLEKYLLDKKNVLNVEKITDHVFPKVHADIFISHSHLDRGIAIKLALSLESIGLRTFVDSCAWGYADDLLRKIDDEFCVPEGWSSYSYELRNRTTTNVHMILNSALQRMIDDSELFIFLSSDNSVVIEDYVNGVEHLSSPWIFSELTFAGMVQRKPRKRFVRSVENRKFEANASVQNGVEFSYKLPDLRHSMEFDAFLDWIRAFDASSNMPRELTALDHLDTLYRRLRVNSDLLVESRIKV